jgi:hypothetical protein
VVNYFLIIEEAPLEEPLFPEAKEICEKVKSGGGFNTLVNHSS